MRLDGFISFSLVALSTCLPAVLRAQFQEPTKEELQMTADSKAPGASAVYLYREDITDQPTSTRTFYERIKVLSEKGKEQATIHFPYLPSIDKVVDVEARTIHPDGTVVPLTDKPSELVEVKTKGFQVNNLVFTLPSVEVGSILEYRYTIQLENHVTPPTWEVQRKYYVRRAHYEWLLTIYSRTLSRRMTCFLVDGVYENL